MQESVPHEMSHRISKFLRGARCITQGQPPTDELMQQWMDGTLHKDAAANAKLTAAIKFSLTQVGMAESGTVGPDGDTRNCNLERAEILKSIQRAYG